MLSFMLCLVPSYLVAYRLAEIRPKRSSALLFYPILALVALLSGLAASLLGLPIEQNLNNQIRNVLASALVGSFEIWRSAPRLAKIRSLSKRPVDSIDNDNLADDGSTPKENQSMDFYATTYRNEVKVLIAKIEGLSPEWRECVLDQLAVDPSAEVESLIRTSSVALKESFPFDGSDMERAYESMAHLSDYEKKQYRRACFALGDKAEFSTIAQTILERNEAGVGLLPGIYIMGNAKFRLLPNGAAILLNDEKGTELVEQPRFEDVLQLRTRLRLPPTDRPIKID